ncbi:MAG: histidine--tRNA ligase [Ruminococcaceae bacterium]|nr:histidine--tRNA ligase [Oscillospiraceae bacterium]
MAVMLSAPRGTQDVLPSQSGKWQFIEECARKTATVFGFKEVRFPTFEHTELFCRGVGDTTDVVQKEMYTFEDKGGRSITLRPEGTASTVRTILSNGLLSEALPLKLYYLTSCFRYEKPQAGRLREFHQFGMECFGSAEPIADAQLIASASYFFKVLGISGLKLELNSIGCPECRKKYHEALKKYFEEKNESLCETCIGRLEKNPMRILDCKSPVCSEIAKDAPKVIDYLCDECDTHFKKVQQYLDAMGIEYTVNPNIVRGLDYYTKTVFEFVSSSIGAQGTVCGGGRYDGLVETLGGAKTCALGYAIGIERLILLMQAQEAAFPESKKCEIYIAPMGEKASVKACKMVSALRDEGFFAECDLVGRGIKAQMKYANKIGAEFVVVIGDNEIEENSANLKDMNSGEESKISLGDSFIKEFYDKKLSAACNNVLSSLENLTK